MCRAERGRSVRAGDEPAAVTSGLQPATGADAAVTLAPPAAVASALHGTVCTSDEGLSAGQLRHGAQDISAAL